MSLHTDITASHTPPPPIKSANVPFLNPATSVYPILPTEIIDSILGYLCILQAQSMSSASLALAVSSISSTTTDTSANGDETPLPPLRSMKRRNSPTVALLPILLVNSYFNRLAQRRLYAAVVTRGVKRCVLFLKTLVRCYNREKEWEKSNEGFCGDRTTTTVAGTGTGGVGGPGGKRGRDTKRSFPLLLVKSFKVDISGEQRVLGGFYNLLKHVLQIFSSLSSTISLVDLHLDFPEIHSPSGLLENCKPLLKRLHVFSTSMHCQRPLARALAEMDELKELTLRGFQREVDRSVFQVIGGMDNWNADDDDDTGDEADDDVQDRSMGDEDEDDWGEFPSSVSGGLGARGQRRRPRRDFYLPRKALRKLVVFNAIHSRPGIIREVLRGRDVQVVSVPVFSGLGIQTLDAVARAGRRREEERMRRRDMRRRRANGKEKDDDAEALIAPLPPPSVRRLSIISFDPESPAYLLPELVKRFGTPGWDVRLAPTITPSSRTDGSASAFQQVSRPKRHSAETKSNNKAKRHSHSKCRHRCHVSDVPERDPDDCQLEALHLVVLLAECSTEMLEDNAKWLGAFKGLKNMTYMAASSSPRSPPAQPPPPAMPAPILPSPPSAAAGTVAPLPGLSLSPAPFDITPSSSSMSLGMISTSASSSTQPSTSSSTSSLPPITSEADMDEDIHMGSTTNADTSSSLDDNAGTSLPADSSANANDQSHNDVTADDMDADADAHAHADPFLDDPEMSLDEAEIARMWHRACPSLETIILPMGKVWFRRP
ncbi:hypothetical protein CVT24_002960 [Panaeolus cyanescens]|uniref:Uncharacterized protein n=1 Tax=Panaeolus cyanescens TaxID=181874 RepID=A0A409VPF1_9AGAR|nr:hypothetical protein CVT24_002960 [Panaeolus cyanescens]